MAEKDVFGYIWIGRPKPVEELSHEEVIWYTKSWVERL